MGLKTLYNYLYSRANKRSEILEKKKTAIAELYSVYKRHDMYQSVTWSKDQQDEFDNYWIENYGKKISNKWHKIYQSVNGVFRVDYIPEMMFSTKIEYVINDYRYARVFEDKAIIETLAGAIHCRTPETVLVCSKGRLFDNKRAPISFEKAFQCIKSVKRDIVIKPTVDSGSGKNIHFISSDELETSDRVLQEMGGDYIVQLAIQPNSVFASLNPSSINTLRVMTYILNDRIYHMPIACRIGGGQSKLDNIHAGGLVIGVEDNGKLLDVAYLLGYGDTNIKCKEHPHTKVVFSEITLPSIEKVINAAYAAHCRLPHIGIVSWDFTVDQDGEPVLIEANIHNQSIWIPQFIHGKGAFEKNTASVLSMI